MLILMYLVTASHTQGNDNLVIQKLSKFLVYRTLDVFTKDTLVGFTAVTNLVPRVLVTFVQRNGKRGTLG